MTRQGITFSTALYPITILPPPTAGLVGAAVITLDRSSSGKTIDASILRFVFVTENIEKRLKRSLKKCVVMLFLPKGRPAYL